MFTPIQSSYLDSASYDGTDKLQVKLKNGSIYEYSGVKPDVYNQFEETFDKDSKEASSGRFFTANIKPLPFKKV